MHATATCRNCGSEIGPGSPFGHCPKCLIAQGLVDETPSSNGSAASERRIGDYELLEQIGRGGMGVVYRARQISLKREVALKMILPADAMRAEAIKRFQLEAEAAAKLQHPNIVPIYDVRREGSQHYFSMQLIEGANLNQCLARFRLPEASLLTSRAQARQAQEKIARLLGTMARAVHFAHERGIFHRDLKPQNILIDKDDEPFLTDFGLAKILDSEESITERSALLGTLNYMSPEQAAGARVGRAADVFSLGAILYELLTATPPFRGVTPAETLRLIAEKEPARPQSVNKWVDTDLAVICLKCLQKNPHERYISAGELADDLDRWLGDEPILARPISRTMRAGRWVRRNRVLAGLVATVAAAVLLGAWLGFDKWETGELQRQFAIDFVQQREDLNNGRVEYIHLTPVILAAATGKRATHQPNATRLRIGIYTELGQMENIIKLTPFLRKIEQEVSRTCPVRIELFEYRRRESMESDFLQDRLDVIRIGEGPLARLRRHDLAITPLVQQVGGGKTSVVFVAASSSIRRIEELKGTSFIAGSPTATSSGFKLLEILLEAGVNADNIRLTYRNNSENNLEAVLRGEFPAGVTRKDKLVGSLTNHFRTLKEFPTTTMPWAARANLDSGIAPAFTAALVNTKDPKILRNLPDDASGGFKPADLEYFEWLDGQIRKIEEQFFGSEGIDGYLKRK